MTEHEVQEALLTGYLDGELTQGDAQRVRLHLERCSECRTSFDDLRELAKATRTSSFAVPDDTQWDEAPRSVASRVLGGSGLVFAAIWAVSISAYLLWQVLSDDGSPRFEALVGVAFATAAMLVVASAFIDRLRIRKSDPYRKVMK